MKRKKRISKVSVLAEVLASDQEITEAELGVVARSTQVIMGVEVRPKCLGERKVGFL